MVAAAIALLPALAAGLLLLAIGSFPDDPNKPATVRFEGVVMGLIGGVMILVLGTGIGAVIGALVGGARALLFGKPGPR